MEIFLDFLDGRDVNRLKVTTREDFVGLGRIYCERRSGPVSVHVRFDEVFREAMTGEATGRILYSRLSPICRENNKCLCL